MAEDDLVDFAQLRERELGVEEAVRHGGIRRARAQPCERRRDDLPVVEGEIRQGVGAEPRDVGVLPGRGGGACGIARAVLRPIGDGDKALGIRAAFDRTEE